MDKNTITGLLLIGALLFGFTMYNNNQTEKKRGVQQKIDSINYVNQQAFAKELAQTEKQGDKFTSKQEANYLTAEMNAAASGTEQFYTLENDKIIAKISNLGGAIKSVELKDYKTYDEKPLYLFKEKNSMFNLSFFTNTLNNTSNFYFKNLSGNVNVVKENDSQSLIMSLPLSETASIDYVYTIKTGSNMVDFSIKMNGTSELLSPRQNELFLEWSNVSPQQEKGFKYENTYTTVAYMYPNDDSMDELSMGEGNNSEEIDSRVKWVAFKQQFFSSVFISNDSFNNANISYETLPEGSGDIKHFKATMSIPYNMTVDQYDFSFFFGANNYSDLKQYNENLEKLVPLGWGILGWVNKLIIIPAFNFLGGFISNYGIIILLLTLYIKSLLFIFTYKSYRSMAKMRILKPEVDELAKKYPKKEDAMKKQQATMELYRKAGANPMGGCLPMLLQFPILLAMYRFFPASIELRGKSFLWANDLSSYDSILDLPFSIPLYGNHVSLFALLMGVSVIISSKINMQNNSSSTQMPGMQFMMVYVMPIMLIVWFNSYSSGLSYYYLLSNIITICQMIIIRRFVSDTKLHAQMKAYAKKPKKKGKWASRYEDMVKQQEQMRQQQKRK